MPQNQFENRGENQPPSPLPSTLGELRSSAWPASLIAGRSVKDELRSNLIRKTKAPRKALSRHRRLRRHRRAAGGQRTSFPPQLHSARAARPGEDASDPHADHAARSLDSLSWQAVRFTTIPYAPLCRPLQAADSRSRAMRHRLRGWRPTIVTWKNWPRPMSRSRT